MLTEILASPWLWMPLAVLGAVVVVSVVVLLGAAGTYLAAYLTGWADPIDLILSERTVGQDGLPRSRPEERRAA